MRQAGFTGLRRWVTAIAAFGLLGFATTPSAAATIILTLPADETYAYLFDRPLPSEGAGRYRLDVTVNRELPYLYARSFLKVDNHGYADVGDEGWHEQWLEDNALSSSQWSHGFSLTYFVRADTHEHHDGGIFNPETGADDIGYWEDYLYTPVLWTEMAFAPGEGPIRLTLTVSAIPEPATWAMMIIGFGLTGAMIRHRRKAGLAPA